MSGLREKLAEAQFEQIDFYPWAEAEPMTWEEAKQRDTEDRTTQCDEAYLRADAALKVFADWLESEVGRLRSIADGNDEGVIRGQFAFYPALTYDRLASTLKDQSHD